MLTQGEVTKGEVRVRSHVTARVGIACSAAKRDRRLVVLALPSPRESPIEPEVALLIVEIGPSLLEKLDGFFVILGLV